PTASALPPASQATPRTCLPAPYSSVCRRFPDASQTRAALSTAAATAPPSGDQEASHTSPWAATSRSARPVPASQIRSVRSWLPDTSWLPSGDHATALTACLFASSPPAVLFDPT